MFDFKRKSKQKDEAKSVFNSIRLLYFNRPVDEMISMALDRENKKLEVYWNGNAYLMSTDRLTVSYYRNIYSSFLAQGDRVFVDDWYIMRDLLLRENNLRNRKNEIKNCDGLKLAYQMKDNSDLICLITSEVFIYMSQIFKELRAYTESDKYREIEL